jgi:uncharacterized membrane protein YdfJ with MMPL/SSD domain
MTVTASRTGRAFCVSALTVVAGIVVVATSPMPMLRDFGIVMALNVTVALLSALIVLPPVLVWAEERHGWISRGLLRTVPEPFAFDDVKPARLAPSSVLAERDCDERDDPPTPADVGGLSEGWSVKGV